MEKALLIQTLNALGPILPEEEKLVRSLFTGIRIPAKTFLVQEGEVCHSVYFVVKGCARIGINAINGDDISCYFADEGGWIGIYESFLTGEPAKYFVQTIEDCELLVIDRMGLETLFTDTKNGNLLGRRLAEGLLVSTVNRLTDFYLYTPEERFQHFVDQFPRLAGRLPQNHLASYIGVKPQSLSRIKKRIFSAT